MSTSKYASSFAPYTPPPDDPAYDPPPVPASKFPARRPWFPTHPSSPDIGHSYQSGGIPTWNTSMDEGAGSVEAESSQNQWETRYGTRVDLLAALAYLLGPVSALALLIIETQNDYVRFHAYQSALLTTPLVILRVTVLLLQFPSWLQTCFTILILIPPIYMAMKANRDASQNGLVHYQLPVIGPLAERWLGEE